MTVKLVQLKCELPLEKVPEYATLRKLVACPFMPLFEAAYKIDEMSYGYIFRFEQLVDLYSAWRLVKFTISMLDDHLCWR